MRRVTQVLGILLLMAIVAVGFQNCGTYQANQNGFDKDSASKCIGSECAIAPESISIAIGSQSIPVYKPTGAKTSCTSTSADPSWCIDVAGYCDAGGYPDSRIYAQLKTGPTPIPEYLTEAKCDDMGRFRVSVALPANYDFDQFYEIEVRLEGIGEDGQAIRNPLPVDYSSVGLVPAI
ncbi:MAG TPA: hypothetical protein VM432_13365 [Bdellovibrionales bacterium]|nr:hypothetical protein [Bdellovibrionales bacterium]